MKKKVTSSIRIYAADYQWFLGEKRKQNRQRALDKRQGKKIFIADIIHDMLN